MRSEPLGDLHDPLDVRVRELLVELEPEVRELQRDVAGQLLRVEPFEDAPVLVRDRLRLGGVAHALAEQRRVRVEPLVCEAVQHCDARVDRLAGDEPGGAEPHSVAAHEALVGAADHTERDQRVEGEAFSIAAFCSSRAFQSMVTFGL